MIPESITYFLLGGLAVFLIIWIICFFALIAYIEADPLRSLLLLFRSANDLRNLIVYELILKHDEMQKKQLAFTRKIIEKDVFTEETSRKLEAHHFNRVRNTSIEDGRFHIELAYVDLKLSCHPDRGVRELGRKYDRISAHISLNMQIIQRIVPIIFPFAKMTVGKTRP